MPALGLSAAGRDAKISSEELARMFDDLTREIMGSARGDLQTSDALRQFLLPYIFDSPDFGDVDFIRGTGQSILPGVDDAIANRRGRAASLRGIFENSPQLSSLLDRLNANTDEYGRSIGSTFDTIDALTNSRVNQMRGNSDATNRRIVGNIGDTYDAASGAAADSGRRVAGDIDSTFSSLLGQADSTFGDAAKLIERLRPGGEANAARVGRSFAPALASTSLRLRQAGIDPSSFEGNSQLQRVEASRARAMDDASYEGERDYTDAMTRILRDRLGANIDLSTGRLDRSTGAENRRADIERGLTLGRGSDFRRQLAENLANELGLTRLDLEANTANVNAAQDPSRDYYNARRDDIDRSQTMTARDIQLRSALDDRENDADDYGLDSLMRQFDIGRRHRGDTLDRWDRNADRMTNFYRTVRGNADQGFSTGGSTGNAAFEGNQRTVQNGRGWLEPYLAAGVGAATGAFGDWLSGGFGSSNRRTRGAR